MIKLVNLTPHPINFMNGLVLFPEKDPVRLEEKIVKRIEGFQTLEDPETWYPEGYPTHEKHTIDTVPIIQKRWGSGNLPVPRKGVRYIVSALVANAYPERKDLLCPSTIKDCDGNTVCVALIQSVAKQGNLQNISLQ